MTLHGTKENVVNTINLDSLVDHEDHYQMHIGVFVCNLGIYGSGIGAPSLLIKAIDVNEMIIVTKD